MFKILEIFFENFERFTLYSSKFSIFDVEKISYFFKQVRILPEIDWYHYQDANNAAPTGVVRHWINTYPF